MQSREDKEEIKNWEKIKNCRQAEMLGVGECDACKEHDECWGGKMKVGILTDTELNEAFDGAFSKPVNFNHKPTPEDLLTIRLRAVAQAQHDKEWEKLKDKVEVSDVSSLDVR